MKGDKDSLQSVNGYENSLRASASAIGVGVNSVKKDFCCDHCETEDVEIYVEGWKYIVFSCNKCENYEMPSLEEIARADLGQPIVESPQLFSIITDEEK